MTDEERMKKIDEFLSKKDKTLYYKRCKLCQAVLTVNDGSNDLCEFCNKFLKRKVKHERQKLSRL